MTPRDPELVQLLVQELERHLPLLKPEGEASDGARRAVHALKGSAGLAGERELAAALERIERRIKEGDGGAFIDASALVEQAITNLAAGKSASPSQWPQPPLDLAPGRISASIRQQYLADARDRLTAVDEAFAHGADAMTTLTAVYRHVHTLKGAASAVGDEPMAWFCHGLEDRLRAAKNDDEAKEALEHVTRWRTVIGALIDDPERALASLRTGVKRRPSFANVPVAAPAPESTRTPDDEGRREGGGTLRVSADAVDRLLERIEAIALARETLHLGAERNRESTGHLRHARATLFEALRLIGPPRPWGAPAAALRRIEAVVAVLGAVADDVNEAVTMMTSREQLVREALVDAKRDLSTMRLTTVRGVFERLARAVEAEAQRTGRSVVVRMTGADEPVDRRVAEALLEPSLQLVRNAVAHGIEPPAERSARGKLAHGTITLAAEGRQGRLVITITDDGAGVDLEAVRRRAVETETVTLAHARELDEASLLSLLFLAGFSTAARTDVLAGRGIGLDIALGSVRRLGGTVRLTTRAGEGFSARIDVPMESGITRVLWVEAGGERYALPAWPSRAVRAATPADDLRAPHLLCCLEDRDAAPAPFVVELEAHHGDERQLLPLGVDAVGHTDELLVRPLSPLIAGIGPYAGAVVLGNGALHLALDVEALAPRIRARMGGAAP